MTTAQIINIVLVVLCAAVYGISLYFKTRGSAAEAATQFIAEIENSGLLGPEKMAFVVGQLVGMIPLPLRTIFTAERLQEIAQEIFDNMKQYALEYLKRIDEEQEAPDVAEED